MRFVAPRSAPKGFARRVPPAIFSVQLGLFGLGLAWRRAVVAFDLPAGLAEAALGAISLFFVYTMCSYAAKFMRRPAVVIDDLAVLPGTLGLSAMMVCLYLLASAMSPYAPDLARVILLGGIGLHGVLICLILWHFARGPAERRRYSPTGHLFFVSPIVAGMVAAQAGYDYLALGLIGFTLLLAVGIWSWGADRMWRGGMTPALRPALALHLVPAAVGGLGAAYLDLMGFAQVMAAISAVILLGLILGIRQITAAGFSPFWSSAIFPLAATSSLWISLGGKWQIAGGLALIGATLVGLPIAYRIVKLWLSGQLAVRTNAAIA